MAKLAAKDIIEVVDHKVLKNGEISFKMKTKYDGKTKVRWVRKSGLKSARSNCMIRYYSKTYKVATYQEFESKAVLDSTQEMMAAMTLNKSSPKGSNWKREGSKVEVYSKSKKRWYNGTIAKVDHSDESMTVHYIIDNMTYTKDVFKGDGVVRPRRGGVDDDQKTKQSPQINVYNTQIVFSDKSVYQKKAKAASSQTGCKYQLDQRVRIEYKDKWYLGRIISTKMDVKKGFKVTVQYENNPDAAQRNIFCRHWCNTILCSIANEGMIYCRED
eukprot:338865_1